MYIAFVALYLLTCVDFPKIFKEPAKPVIEEIYKPIYANYTDLSNNVIDFNYCGLNSCLIKCCADGEYFDSDDICREEQYFKKSVKDVGSINGLSKSWDELKTGISDANKKLSEHFVFILRENNVTPPKRNFTPDNSFLLPDGYLVFKQDDSSSFNDVWPLHFCADHKFEFINDEVNVKFVYDLSKVPEELPKRDESDNNETPVIEFYVLGGGMLFTTLTIATSLSRLRKLGRGDSLMLNYVAYSITLICAYGLKILQLISLKSRKLDNSERVCEMFCAPMYYLLLSAFCWPIVFSYDTLKTFIKLRVIDKDKYKTDIGTFWGYCSFAWGLPLLVTILVLTLDKLDIGIQETPFHNCFSDGNQTVFFLLLPVSILLFIRTILFLSYSYQMWRVCLSLRNNPSVDQSYRHKISSIVFRDVITLSILFVIIQFVPYQPDILYFDINAWIIIGWFTYTFIIMSNAIPDRLCKRVENAGNTGEYQELKEDTSTSLDQMGSNTIAVISNNELDKKKPLNFIYNIDLGKDIIMANIITQEYVKLENNPDLHKNGDDVISNHDIEKCENIFTDEISKKY